MKIVKRIIGLAAGLVLVFSLGACGGSMDSSEGEPGYPTSTSAPVGPDDQEGGVKPDEGTSGLDGSITRSVVETAYLSLETDNLSETSEEIKLLVTTAGGFIDSWQQQSNDAGELWQVYATLRMPAKDLEKSLDGLGALGQAKSLERSATDVTTQVIDLDARITALEASVQRLLALIDSAGTTSELLEAESYLSQRQAELESLKSQREYLSSAISYATVTVSVYQKGAAATDSPSNFWEGLVAGWNGLVAFLAGSTVVLGVLAPWVLLTLPFAALGWYLWRRRNRIKSTGSK